MDARACSCIAAALLAACSDAREPRVDTSELALAARVSARASSEFERLLRSGDTDPVEALRERLFSYSDVAQVEVAAEHGSVIARLRNGTSTTVLVADEARTEWAAPVRLPSTGGTRQLESDRSITCGASTYPQSTKACIVTAFTETNLDVLERSLEHAGYSIAEIHLRTYSAVKDLRSQLGTCGVLYIRTHGGLARNNLGDLAPHVATAIEFDDARASELVDAVGRRDRYGVVGIGAKSYWSLSPAFFASATYPNSLVYVDAGSSAAQGPAYIPISFISAFTGNGAGAFFGWEAAVSAKLSKPIAERIFDALAPEVAIDAISLTVPKSVAIEPYVATAAIAPARPGIDLALSVWTSAGLAPPPQLRRTDGNGSVTFDAVRGAIETGAVDTVTLSAGGANNATTSAELVKIDATLPSFDLSWIDGDHGAARFYFAKKIQNYNLVCANPKHTKSATVLKLD
jgi:hypothetical protein